MSSPPAEMSFDNLLNQTPPSEVQLPPFASLFTFPDSPTPPPTQQASTSQPEFIDLTTDTSPPQRNTRSPTIMSRRASDEPARKRRRVIIDDSDQESVHAGPSFTSNEDIDSSFVMIDDEGEGSNSDSDIEEVDLTAVEDEADLRRAQEEQRKQRDLRAQLQKDALAVQAEVSSNEPARLSNLSCIICMDNITNLAATHCGHLFCHECLIQALQAGENGTDNAKASKCPVCRKPVSRTIKPNSKSLPQVIPLEIKVKRRIVKSDKARGKERAVNQATA